MRTGSRGLAASFQPLPLTPPALYRARNVRATALYQLLESYFEDVESVWEERFEKRYLYWRGFADTVVARYRDCGVEEAGFARLRCDTDGVEKLITLSCKQRGTCPSCDAKRAAAFAVFLKGDLLENVRHKLSLAITPGGNSIVSIGGDTVRVWPLSPADRQESRILAKATSAANPFVVVDPLSQHAVVAAGRGRLLVIPLDGGPSREIEGIFPAESLVNFVALGDNGSLAVVAVYLGPPEDRKVRMVDL